MCLAKAYFSKSADKSILEDIAHMWLHDDRVKLGTLFGEEKVIPGRVVEIDFTTSKILLDQHHETGKA